MIAGIKFRQDFTEKKDEERKYNCLENETPHLRHAIENRTQYEIRQNDNRHIDKIIGDKNCGEQAFRFRQHSANQRTVRRPVEIFEVFVVERKIGDFTAGDKSGKDKCATGYNESHDLRH